jgi:hypothetical protein
MLSSLRSGSVYQTEKTIPAPYPPIDCTCSRRERTTMTLRTFYRVKVRVSVHPLKDLTLAIAFPVIRKVFSKRDLCIVHSKQGQQKINKKGVLERSRKRKEKKGDVGPKLTRTSHNDDTCSYRTRRTPWWCSYHVRLRTLWHTLLP